jgi:hypothetical protein
MTQVSSKPYERPRPRESREDRDPAMAGVVPWEQGRLFAQLFGDDAAHTGYGAAQSGMGMPAAVAMIDALAEQLAPQVLGAAQWPLQATLYIPRLGRINASVRREQNVWGIELEAEHEATSRWLCGVRQQCQERMAGALGSPVSLHLPDARPA